MTLKSFEDPTHPDYLDVDWSTVSWRQLIEAIRERKAQLKFMKRCIVYTFGKFNPIVQFKVCIHPVTELEVATDAHTLLERYDPTLIMSDPKTEFTQLKEEFLRYRTDGYELVNWNVGMIREEHLRGSDRWEDVTLYAVV